jgi:hypothetical protein
MDTTLVNALAAIASAVAALGSVVVAVYIGRRTESLAAIERQRAEALAASERRHASFNTIAEWRRDLREWAADAIEVLSEASYLCDDAEFDSTDDQARTLNQARTFSCRFRLSSIIDRGRFFLPNIRREEYGTEKPYAYQGLRHSGLDPLVATERVLSTGFTGGFTDRKHAVVAMKREFVSYIQRILDPERHNQEVARMILEAHEAAGDKRGLGGLLTDEQTTPMGAEAMLLKPPSAHVGLRESESSSSPSSPVA